MGSLVATLGRMSAVIREQAAMIAELHDLLASPHPQTTVNSLDSK